MIEYNYSPLCLALIVFRRTTESRRYYFSIFFSFFEGQGYLYTKRKTRALRTSWKEYDPTIHTFSVSVFQFTFGHGLVLKNLKRQVLPSKR